MALRCSAPPSGRERWSLRLLRDRMIGLDYVETISHESVLQLKKSKLKPWRVKSWVIPHAEDDPARAAFVCQMEQVLDVYARPYDPARQVVCLDEARRQLVSEKRQPFTDRQGTRYVDYEYKREGVATLYMVCEPLGGYREVLVRESQDRFNWARVVAHLIEEVYPDADRLTLVQDNLSAHTAKALYEGFDPGRARRILRTLEIVSTPVHGSWLNIAELELSVLVRQGLTEPTL